MGVQFLLGGQALEVMHGNVTLISEGSGAVLDAGCASRVIDVNGGAQLFMKRVHVINSRWRWDLPQR